MKVKFQVPEGVRPGQKILVNSPTGQHIAVIIPRMAVIGSWITVMVPKSVPNPTISSSSIEKNITNPMYSGGVTSNDSFVNSEEDNDEEDNNDSNEEEEDELDLVI